MPQAAEAISVLSNIPANPSSIHHFGRVARVRIDNARGQLAAALNISAHDIIFTSGGTEANNLVRQFFAHIITSAIEHDAILAACPDAQIVPVDEHGRVRLDRLEEMLATLGDADKPDILVSIMAANNETGTFQPIAEIAALCHEYQVACHSDMIQYLCKEAIDLAALDLDFASFSAHKIGGPSGVGALYCRAGRQLQSLLRGGGQEQNRRAGTENLPGIVGFGAAMAACNNVATGSQTIWRDKAEKDIITACPEIEVMGVNAPRLANTSALYLPGLAAQKAVMMLDLAGFCKCRSSLFFWQGRTAM